MSAHADWSRELVGYLKSITRELRFDWGAIETAVRAHAAAELAYADTSFVTCKSCREVFALDYSVESVPASTISTDASDTAIQSPAVVEVGSNVGAGQQVNAEMATMLQDYESMSLDDLIIHVNNKEEQMKKRKEEIFGKILSSLGGDAGNTMEAGVNSFDFEQTRQAYNDNLAAKEMERLNKLAYEEEQLERTRLELEREALRKRFDHGSADQEGVDPLSPTASDGTRDLNGNTRSASKYEINSAGGARQGEKKSAELEYIDSLPYDPTVVQALESYMETHEFDVMLTELEKEIEAMAPSKSEDEEPTELSEILKVLETAAASKAAISSSRGSQTSGIVLSAPVATLPSPKVSHVDSTAPIPCSPGNLPPANAANAVGRSTTEVTSDVENRMPLIADSLKFNRSVAGSGVHDVAAREIPYDRSRRQLVGTCSTGTAAIEHKGGYDSENSLGAGSGEEGVGSSDSEDDWRAMRNKQKKSADRVHSRTKGVPSTSTANSNTLFSSSGTFWGAYGASTKLNQISRCSGVRELSRDDEEVKDVRINPNIDELVVTSHVRKGDLSDEEHPHSETDSEEDVADSVPVIREMLQVVNDSTMTEAETSCYDSPLLPEQIIDLPLPSPPLASPPVSAQATEKAEAARFQSPLPPPVPASIVVPVSSGVLGAASAGNRRMKGKTGSIMNAARPRKMGTSDTSALEGTSSATALAGASVGDMAVKSVLTPPDISTVPSVQPILIGTESTLTHTTSLDSSLPRVGVDESHQVEVSEAEIAALRYASALKRAVALDSVSAPPLSPLPCAYISDRSCGSTLDFPVGSLPAKFASVGVPLERIVLVDILPDQFYSSASAASQVAIVEWLMGAVLGKYELLGMQSCETRGAVVCRIVLRTICETTSAAELISIALETPASCICEGISTNHSTLGDALFVRDCYTSPELNADLECFRSTLSDELKLVNAEPTSPLLVCSRDIAVCAIKSHVLMKPTVSPGRKGVLSELIAQCERDGLRMCGIRLVHLNALELFKYDAHCSIPAYTKPCTIDVEAASLVPFDQHLLPVLCMAFYSAGTGCSVPDIPSSATSTAGTTWKSSSSATNNAASILRTILGPEDPELARRTDPTSLRAIYGTSKDHNVAYPVPHSVDKLLRETSFWFGKRENFAVEVAVNSSVSLLCVSPPRYVNLSWEIKAQQSALTASSASELSHVQSVVLNAVNDSFSSTGILSSISTGGSAARIFVTDGKIDAHQCKAESDGKLTSIQRCSTSFLTHAGDYYIKKVIEMINKKSRKVLGVWELDLQWECSTTNRAESTTGSRLVALEMLKRIKEDDVKSHEDVGLSDVVLLTVGNFPVLTSACVDGVRHFSTPPTSTVLLTVLLRTLSLYPKTCNANIIAMKTNSTTSGLLVAVRGYQVIENTDYAISELQRTLSSEVPSASTKTGFIAGAGFDVHKGRNRIADMESRIASTVRCYKAKKGLEILFTEFALSSVYVDLALRDLYTYVPLPGLQRLGLSWHHQAAAQAEASSKLSVPASSAIPLSAAISTNLLKYSTSQYLQALYAPGVFSAVGVVLIPWLHDSAAMTRNVAKVITRLEKESFSIIEIRASNVPEALINGLYEESVDEYTSVAGRTVDFGTETNNRDEVSATIKIMCKASFMVVLVRRRSALLHLKSVIGPAHSVELAEAHYPRSISFLLASLKVASGSNSPGHTASLPLVLSTLSCNSAQLALLELFPHFYGNFEAQQAALSLNYLPGSCGHTSGSDSVNIEHIADDEVGSGLINGIPLRIPMIPRLNGGRIEQCICTSLQLKCENDAATAEKSVVSVGKSVDIAGIVISYELLRQIGIGLIIEALYREGLVIRNAYTSHLSSGAVKQLMQLAGASSLSMKPPTRLLADVPALVLGLEGPSHSFIRFKSYPLQPKSSELLWKLCSSCSVTSSSTADAGIVGEFGVLASSSSRLAKDLYRHCFEEIHGEDSAFEFK